MQYVTEDLSPVKKKITVTVPVEEVDAALAAAIAIYRTNIQLDGFRKGKVPASIIEKRFHSRVYQEATTDLVNVHINEIISEGKFSPISRIDFDGGELERGKEFVYGISFEVMPEFELPAYEGFEVEQEEAEVDESEVDAVLERMRGNMAEIVAVGEDREPRDGEIAVIDFQALDEKGEPVPGVSANNFQLTLGEGQTLPDFEALIKSMKSGEDKEGPVSFPADFLNPEFAGRTVTMKVKLHAIKERKLPEDDEAFAKKAGMATMEGLRNTLRKSYLSSRDNLNKSATEKKLLDDLLKMADFPVPDGLLENHVRLLVDNLRGRLERHGKDFASLGKSMEQIREELRPEAEMQARAHIFLLTLARKKGFEVSEQEVDAQLRRMAMQSGQDYNALKEYYTEHNLLFGLRDRLLADKAMEEIYDKALVKKVPAKKPEVAAETEGAPAPEAKADEGDAAPETKAGEGDAAPEAKEAEAGSEA